LTDWAVFGRKASTMRVLITGITGFAGGHLAEALLEDGRHELIGLSRGDWPTSLRHLAVRIPLQAAELSDRPALEALLNATRPEGIVHLAGYAAVGRSFQQPAEAWRDNLQASLSLFEAIAAVFGTRPPRVLYVGSGLVYGDSPSPEHSFSEDAPLRPTSPYAASKAAADLAAFQYHASHRLPVVRVRPFNHLGPRQSTDFAVPAFARQVAAVRRGLQPPRVRTGDLSAARDLTDVRDTVRAYVLLLERGRPGEAYNVGSGELHTMREVLNRLLALAGVEAEIEVAPERLRPAEAAFSRCDARKIANELGWCPTRPLDDSLADVLRGCDRELDAESPCPS
jgi:GDP-4-dehydro-6-deoxy-D-mannose reductase